jgi:hypothetical protein
LQIAKAKPSSSGLTRSTILRAVTPCSILKASSLVTGYSSTLRVLETDGGKGSRVEWSARFTPKGVSNQEASRIYPDIFEDGLKALSNRICVEGEEEKVRIVRRRAPA